MVEPGLADGVELAAEPAADDVDRDARVGQMADRRDLLGEQRRMPGAGQHRGDDFQLLGGGEQGVREGHRLVLILGAVAGGEADLAQRIGKAGRLGDLGEAAVVVDVPAGALGDLADHQAARDVRHPIGELNGGVGRRRRRARLRRMRGRRRWRGCGVGHDRAAS